MHGVGCGDDNDGKYIFGFDRILFVNTFVIPHYHSLTLESPAPVNLKTNLVHALKFLLSRIERCILYVHFTFDEKQGMLKTACKKAFI